MAARSATGERTPSGGRHVSPSRTCIALIPHGLAHRPVSPRATCGCGCHPHPHAGAPAPVEFSGPKNHGCVRVRVRTGAGDPRVRQGARTHTCTRVRVRVAKYKGPIQKKGAVYSTYKGSATATIAETLRPALRRGTALSMGNARIVPPTQAGQHASVRRPDWTAP